MPIGTAYQLICLGQVLVSVSLNTHIGISFPQMTDRRPH